MRIEVDRENLLRVLLKVGGVVERRQTLPILGNLLLTTEKDAIEITATDLEVEIRAKTKARIRRAGEVTLPARKLVDICRALPERLSMTIDVARERASVVAGRSRFTLGTLPATVFPKTEECLSGQIIKMEESLFKRVLEKVSFAMANQDVRYYLNGLYLEFLQKRLISVATDGHRLAKVEEEWDMGEDFQSAQIIIPRKTVLELCRLLSGDVSEKVDVYVSEKSVRVITRDTMVTSKLLEGRYPEYEKVIPENCERVVYANREDLRQALGRVSILANEKYRGVRLGFGNNCVKIQTQNPEKEVAEEDLEIEYAQDEAVIGFNVAYLIDVLNVLEDDVVELGFNDSNSSARLRGKGSEEGEYVVMPMRL